MKREIYRIAFIIMLCFIAANNASAKNKAKYVFYLITDGTGINTVLATEMYKAAREGRIGRVPCVMSQFPVVGVASTFSVSSGVTDSAASGTALASGVKTVNEAIGVYPDLKTPAVSIAQWAKDAGMRVGVASSCPLNHATPASFVAHRARRTDDYGIALDIAAAGIDFYGASEIHHDNKGEKNVYDVMREAGYEVAFGMDEYNMKAEYAKKILLVQDTTNLHPASGAYTLPYAIERREGDMKIEDILKAEIDFLMKDNKKGFLLVNEVGGKVDYACHAVDGATILAEVEAVDRCVEIALEFYKKHPKETLIVVTSDHETGGLVLAPDNIYKINLQALQYQKVSTDGFTAILRKMRRDTGNKVSWEQIKNALMTNFGFWKHLDMTEAEEQKLYRAWKESFEGKAEEEKNLYSSNEPIAALARNIINQKAMITWNTSGHSAGLVPVYAIGVGQELFASHNDNAEIPKKIAKAAGYKTPFE